jgi:tryptophan 2,3-dioxygenase
MSGVPKDDKVIVKRALEPGMKLDFQPGGQSEGQRQTYSDFLKLDQLLSLQAPIQDPPQRDELLFVILHQVAELWLKLLHAELVEGCRSIRADDLKTCNKTLARSKAILEQLISAWKVLLTMTTADYRAFRGGLGQSSGFQSAGYRLVEFALGNKDSAHLKVHQHDRDLRRSAGLSRPAGISRAGEASGPRSPGALCRRSGGGRDLGQDLSRA